MEAVTHPSLLCSCLARNALESERRTRYRLPDWLLLDACPPMGLQSYGRSHRQLVDSCIRSYFQRHDELASYIYIQIKYLEDVWAGPSLDWVSSFFGALLLRGKGCSLFLVSKHIRHRGTMSTPRLRKSVASLEALDCRAIEVIMFKLCLVRCPFVSTMFSILNTRCRD